MAPRNTNQDENQDEPTVPVMEPNWGALVAAESGSSSSWGLPEGYRYPKRPYRGAASPELEQSSIPNVSYVGGGASRGAAPRRGASDGFGGRIWEQSGRRFMRGDEPGGGGDGVYEGPNLVGADGRIVRSSYTLDNSSVVGEMFMGEMGNVKSRRAILNILYSMGMYSTQQGPSSTGTQSRDISAFRQLLLQSNAMGYTWDVALSKIMADPEFTQMTRGRYGAGGGGGGRAGSDDELALVFANATHDMLGRAPTNKEIRQYISAYRSGGMSATATAQTLVSETAGPEEDAYGYAQMAELMTRMLGGD